MALKAPRLRSLELLLIMEDAIYMPPMPNSIEALKIQITHHTGLDGGMSVRIWTELDFHWDICCVTKKEHIEHFYETLGCISTVGYFTSNETRAEKCL
jgi:hypothetical protein